MSGAYAWTNANLNLFEPQNRGAVKDKAYPWLYLRPEDPGTYTWLIDNHTAYQWPAEDTGQFYQDCVFIILNIKESRIGLVKDVYMWIGKYAKQDEYINGVLLVTDLYELLSGNVTLHREVQGRESQQFLQMFNPAVYWKGSPSGGYRLSTLNQTGYKVRMLQLHRPDPDVDVIIGKEVPCNIKELDPAYTYIVDTGDHMYMWQGDLTDTEEDLQSLRFFEQLRAARGGGVKTEVLNEEHIEGHPFFSYLSKDSYKREGEYQDEDENSTLHRQSLFSGSKRKETRKVQLVKVHFDSKSASRKKRKLDPESCLKYEFRITKYGSISRKDLSDEGVFLFDEGDKIWLWYSRKSLDTEKRLALQYVHEYLKNYVDKLVSVTVVRDEFQHPAFQTRIGRSMVIQNGKH